MSKRVVSIEHPPKVPLSAILARFQDEIMVSIVVGLHEGLKELEQSYVDDDYYDKLLRLWAEVTGTNFRDTVPTYTVEVDGKPQTMADVVTQRDRVQEVTDKMRDEGKL